LYRSSKMWSGKGAPGISTKLSGKRGMSDKRALLCSLTEF
jgi:hypothetical protein